MTADPRKRPLRWRFLVGLRGRRTVTVTAWDFTVALEKADVRLERRDRQRGVESPVAYDLFLVKADRL